MILMVEIDLCGNNYTFHLRDGDLKVFIDIKIHFWSCQLFPVKIWLAHSQMDHIYELTFNEYILTMIQDRVVTELELFSLGHHVFSFTSQLTNLKYGKIMCVNQLKSPQTSNCGLNEKSSEFHNQN